MSLHRGQVGSKRLTFAACSASVCLLLQSCECCVRLLILSPFNHKVIIAGAPVSIEQCLWGIHLLNNLSCSDYTINIVERIAEGVLNHHNINREPVRQIEIANIIRGQIAGIDTFGLFNRGCDCKTFNQCADCVLVTATIGRYDAHAVIAVLILQHLYYFALILHFFTLSLKIIAGAPVRRFGVCAPEHPTRHCIEEREKSYTPLLTLIITATTPTIIIPTIPLSIAISILSPLKYYCSRPWLYLLLNCFGMPCCVAMFTRNQPSFIS